MKTTTLLVTALLSLMACSDAAPLQQPVGSDSQGDSGNTGADLGSNGVGFFDIEAGDTPQFEAWDADAAIPPVGDATDSTTTLDSANADAQDTTAQQPDVVVVPDVSAPDPGDTQDSLEESDTGDAVASPPAFDDWEHAINSNDIKTLTTYLSTYDMPVCENGFCWVFSRQPTNAIVEILGEFNGWAEGTQLDDFPGLSDWYYGKIQVSFDKFTEYLLKVNGQWTRDETNRYIRFGPFGFNSAIYRSGYGRITALWQVQSPQLGNQRDVYVYLPASYFNNIIDTFPVLYLQDGFNVFENPKAPFGSWNVDTTADVVFAEKTARPAIFIAIDTPDRANEYLYTAAALPGGSNATPKLNLYADFVVHTLKPIVDGTFRTKPDRNNTAIAGSSLGGISSAYIAWHHADVFGAAASFSGSFWVGENGESGPPFRDIITANTVGNAAGSIRYYLDSGDTPLGKNAAYTGDSWVYTDWTRNALISTGWQNRPEWDTDSNLTTSPDNLSPSTPPEKVPSLAWEATPPNNFAGWQDYLGTDSNLCCLVGHGHSHNEAAWEQRFGAALRFLFPPDP